MIRNGELIRHAEISRHRSSSSSSRESKKGLAASISSLTTSALSWGVKQLSTALWSSSEEDEEIDRDRSQASAYPAGAFVLKSRAESLSRSLIQDHASRSLFLTDSVLTEAEFTQRLQNLNTCPNAAADAEALLDYMVWTKAVSVEIIGNELVCLCFFLSHESNFLRV